MFIKNVEYWRGTLTVYLSKVTPPAQAGTSTCPLALGSHQDDTKGHKMIVGTDTTQLLETTKLKHVDVILKIQLLNNSARIRSMSPWQTHGISILTRIVSEPINVTLDSLHFVLDSFLIKLDWREINPLIDYLGCLRAEMCGLWKSDWPLGAPHTAQRGIMIALARGLLALIREVSLGVRRSIMIRSRGPRDGELLQVASCTECALCQRCI